MMSGYLGCEEARRRLEAFVDGEFDISEQIAVEGHLRWCDTCAARVQDKRCIGTALRLVSPCGSRLSGEDGAVASSLRVRILARVCQTRESTFVAQAQWAMRERRLLWPAVGAVCAVLICLAGTVAVLHAVSVRVPETLVATIDRVAIPSRERALEALNGPYRLPRVMGETDVYASMVEEEISLAVAAFVTSDGRIANYVLLGSEDKTAASGTPQQTYLDDGLREVLEAVSRTRFEPASAGGQSVPIGLVWVLERTTVRGVAPDGAGDEGAVIQVPIVDQAILSIRSAGERVG